jgi:hypothetical protein
MTTAALARAARISAGTLLILEQRARKALQRATDESIDGAMADLSRVRTERRVAVIAALILSARAMSQKAQAAIRKSRDDARAAAGKRLRVELGAAGVTLPPASLFALHTPRAHEDDLRAQVAAESLAQAWRARAIVASGKATRLELPPMTAVDETRGGLHHLVYRTAATEVAQAYNDEHRAVLEELLENDAAMAEEIAGLKVVRVWDAILDRRTCPECAAHDGEMTPVGMPFSSGDEPPLHPMCRCLSTMTTTEAFALSRAA